MRTICLSSLLACAAIALASGQAAQKPAAQLAAFKIDPLNSPAGADTAEPALTVEGDRAILSWLERHEDHVMLKYSERTAAGWSASQTVIANEKLMVMPADVPSVRALPDGTLVAAWLEDNGGDGESYDLYLSTSKDGRTWSKPAPPHHDGNQTQH